MYLVIHIVTYSLNNCKSITIISPYGEILTLYDITLCGGLVPKVYTTIKTHPTKFPYFSLKNNTYKPGKTKSVSTVEEIIPPVTTTERGYCISEPTPVA